MTNAEFSQRFFELTGNSPLKWQERLFHKHFVANDLPAVVDLPTGLGKTMVMAIWLIARVVNSALPRRLVYVVDRRTVVDQATDVARKLQTAVGSSQLGISPLRGQLADNRDWSRDPSRAAIIIGTVDLIGSALLFSGYRSSYKRRPLEAGMLGQDSLLVLDEAHLSQPFAKLIMSIGRDGPFQTDRNGASHGAPMKVIRMSATSGDSDGDAVFRLDTDPDSPDYDLRPDPDPTTGQERNHVVTRYCAKKWLKKSPPVDTKQLTRTLCAHAIELAQDQSLVGKRILVYVRSPEAATQIATMIREYETHSETTTGKRPSSAKARPYAKSVELLTGTMRGLERDEFLERRIPRRFLDLGTNPAAEANLLPDFLVSTSAGEVGCDFNADHLVCDAAPLDSMIQRLGRVNRRGQGSAIVHLVLDTQPPSKTDLDTARVAASKLFVDNMDVSPRAFVHLKRILSSDQLNRASTPVPTTVELTDVLLDAWSMTSITERMPGRPQVAPWLRGIADDLPQTTVAWRAELDLPGFDQLAPEEIVEWFDAHRVLTHETLSAPTNTVAKWFTERWARLPSAERSLVGGRPIVVDLGGVQVIAVKELIEQLDRKTLDSLRNANLILPASFGGIERGAGLLDPSAPTTAGETDSDEGSAEFAEARMTAPDVADQRGRFRELAATTNDGERTTRSIGSGMKPAKPSRFALELESDTEARMQLVSHVPRRERPELGSQRQTLSEHVNLVRTRLDEILARMNLPDSLMRAAQLAADYHDHGKNRERWQRTVGGVATPPGENWSGETIGKSGGEMKRDPRHYRHEFGSLCELIDSVSAVRAEPPCDMTAAVSDLALHLIATHHGRGRPHFPTGGFDPHAESRSPSIHTDVIRRFARLQRTYGWWQLAWLENLLRCADSLASADNEIRHRSFW